MILMVLIVVCYFSIYGELTIVKRKRRMPNKKAQLSTKTIPSKEKRREYGTFPNLIETMKSLKK